MLGVCYLSEQVVLPVLVMELMDCSLKKMLDRCHNIPMYNKLSILKDVSNGLLYLHSLNPPLMHRDLDTNNIVLTKNLVAKITDLGVMKVVSPLSSDKMTRGVRANVKVVRLKGIAMMSKHCTELAAAKGSLI